MTEKEELELVKFILKNCIRVEANFFHESGYLILDVPELAQTIDHYYKKKKNG